MNLHGTVFSQCMSEHPPRRIPLSLFIDRSRVCCHLRYTNPHDVVGKDLDNNYDPIEACPFLERISPCFLCYMSPDGKRLNELSTPLLKHLHLTRMMAIEQGRETAPAYSLSSDRGRSVFQRYMNPSW